MKVCFIGDSKSIHTKRWYNYFKNEGYSVKIISWNEDPDLPKKSIYKISSSFILRIKYLRAFYILFWTFRKIHVIKPELIHIHMISGYSWACLLIKNIPLIISIGGYDILKMPKISGIHFYLSKLLLNKARAITTSSKQIKSLLINKYEIEEEKIKCFCWGIDFKLFSDILIEDRKKNRLKYDIPENYIVFLHNRYFPAAKYTVLFDSLRKLKSIFQEFKIIVIRSVSVRKEWLKVKDYVKNLELENDVIYIENFISQEEMAKLLSFSDIYINILTHDQRGLSILESMASGAVPVVNNLSVYNEFINDNVNGYILESDEPEYISKKLYWIIQNLSHIKPRISEYNYNYIKENDNRYKNEIIMKEIYNEILH